VLAHVEVVTDRAAAVAKPTKDVGLAILALNLALTEL
jgi:hypothetical protein